MIDWRIQLARRLVETQKIDPNTGGGYWINDTGRVPPSVLKIVSSASV